MKIEIFFYCNLLTKITIFSTNIWQNSWSISAIVWRNLQLFYATSTKFKNFFFSSDWRNKQFYLMILRENSQFYSTIVWRNSPLISAIVWLFFHDRLTKFTIFFAIVDEICKFFYATSWRNWWVFLRPFDKSQDFFLKKLTKFYNFTHGLFDEICYNFCAISGISRLGRKGVKIYNFSITMHLPEKSRKK